MTEPKVVSTSTQLTVLVEAEVGSKDTEAKLNAAIEQAANDYIKSVFPNTQWNLMELELCGWSNNYSTLQVEVSYEKSTR